MIRIHPGLLLALATVAILLTQTPTQATELTLKQCLEMAHRNNPTLKVAGHDSGIQAENVALSDSSFLPKIDLQAGYTSLLEPQAIKSPGGAFETQQPNYASASLGVYQTLYDFGRRSRRKEQAVLRENAVTAGISALKQDVALQVISGYFAILQSLRLVDAARDEVVQREQHLKIATTLYQEGVTTRNDLLQAEVKLAGSRQKLLAVTNQLNNGWLQLNYLTGNPPELRAKLADEELPSPTATPSLEIAGRDEIAAQQAIIKAGEAAVAESRAEFYPEIFIKAGIDYLQNNKAVEQTMVGATAGLKINLFDGQATTVRQRQAVKQLAREKERLRELEETYLLEGRTARNDLAVARERLEMTQAAIRQSEENLRINNDRYQAQVGTATEVIDAQTLLSQARSDHFQALFDYQVARARVQRAAGAL